VAAEWEARGVDGDRAEAEIAVARVPLDQVGEGADAVELGEVDEMDQGGAAGGQLGHRSRRRAHPGDLLRQVGRSYVVALGSHGRGRTLSWRLGTATKEDLT